MKYCSNCGKQIPDGALFCPSCGKSAVSGEPFRPYGDRPPQPPCGQPYYGPRPPYNPDADDFSVLSIVGFILSFFVYIAGLIVSIIALNKAKEDGSRKSASFARAGIIISSVAMGIFVLFFACWAGLIACASCSALLYSCS